MDRVRIPDKNVINPCTMAFPYPDSGYRIIQGMYRQRVLKKTPAGVFSAPQNKTSPFPFKGNIPVGSIPIPVLNEADKKFQSVEQVEESPTAVLSPAGYEYISSR